jgi:hypothetical protein
LWINQNAWKEEQSDSKMDQPETFLHPEPAIGVSTVYPPYAKELAELKEKFKDHRNTENDVHMILWSRVLEHLGYTNVRILSNDRDLLAAVRGAGFVALNMEAFRSYLERRLEDPKTWTQSA